MQEQVQKDQLGLTHSTNHCLTFVAAVQKACLEVESSGQSYTKTQFLRLGARCGLFQTS